MNSISSETYSHTLHIRPNNEFNDIYEVDLEVVSVDPNNQGQYDTIATGRSPNDTIATGRSPNDTIATGRSPMENLWLKNTIVHHVRNRTIATG